MPDPDPDLVASERAALVAWAFARGEQLTTRQIADKLCVSYAGAWVMLQKLSRVLPLAFEDCDGMIEGRWYAIS